MEDVYGYPCFSLSNLIKAHQQEGAPKFRIENNPVRQPYYDLVGDSARINGPLSIKAKMGRNDPCHCGSRKKFKKCCEVA